MSNGRLMAVVIIQRAICRRSGNADPRTPARARRSMRY